jgi:hypothetical protein
VAIGATARAEPATGTVVVGCNEADASLLVDGVEIPERTPAILTLPAGTHVIEARKPPLVAQKRVIELVDQQQIKVRFELLPPSPPKPTTGPDVTVGAGSGSVPPPAGSAPAKPSGAPPPPPSNPPPATGSAPHPSGSASAPAIGPGAPPASNPAAVAPTAPVQTNGPVVKPPRCSEGGREVPCPQGPRCSEGGRPVPCTKGPPPQPPPPPAPVPTPPRSAVTGTGSNAPPELLQVPPGLATIEIATTVPHAVVYVDGAPVREAPCVLELEPGEHVVAVYAAGMLPAEAVVRVEAGKQQHVDLSPSKSRRRVDVPAP